METVEEPPIEPYLDNWYEAANAQIDRGEDAEPIYEGVSEKQMVSSQVVYERSVCGAFWLFPTQILKAWKHKTGHIPKPGEAVFRDSRHSGFCKEAALLINRGIMPDPLVMAKSLTNERILELGGFTYILEHMWHCFCLTSSTHHIDLLVDEWRKRQFTEIASAAIDHASDGDLNAVIMEIGEKSKTLLKTDVKATQFSTNEIFQRMDSIGKDVENELVPTSFPELQTLCGGFPRGQISVVGAPPGYGKTIFLMQEIEAFMLADLTVFAFLLESTEKQFYERWCQRRGVHGKVFKPGGTNTQADRDLIWGASEMLDKSKHNLFGVWRGGYTALEITAITEELMTTTGRKPDLIVVDTLNRMNTHLERETSFSYAGISTNLQILNDLAAKTNATLLIGAQLDKKNISDSFRSGSRVPTLNAFKGGTIGEQAKVAIVLHADDQEMLNNQMPVVEQKLVCVKSNDGGSGWTPSLIFKPLTKIIVDTPDNRRMNSKHFDMFSKHYNINTTRKDNKEIQ